MTPVRHYLLRDIDPKLWARFRARAAGDRIPMRTLLLHFVRLYADGGLTITVQAPAGEEAPKRARRTAARPIKAGRRPVGHGGTTR